MTLEERPLIEKPIKITNEYTKLLDTAQGMMSKTAAVYIPELCALLRDANPNLSNRDIRKKVEDDCDGIWAWGTVTKYWPEWIKDPTKMLRAKERAQKQMQLRAIDETFRKIPKVDPQEFDEPRDYEDLYPHRPLRFDPQMIVDQYHTNDEPYQYKSKDITTLSNELHNAITNIFQTYTRNRKTRIFFTWSTDGIHRKNGMYMIQ